jgi:hypothetical protein
MSSPPFLDAELQTNHVFFTRRLAEVGCWSAHVPSGLAFLNQFLIAQCAQAETFAFRVEGFECDGHKFRISKSGRLRRTDVRETMDTK